MIKSRNAFLSLGVCKFKWFDQIGPMPPHRADFFNEG